MSESGKDDALRSNDAIEALLQHAVPRPVPPAADKALVRDAVHAEWQAVSRGYSRRQQFRNFAIAATVLMALVVAFNALRVENAAPVHVATINKSHGAIYLLGDGSELRELTDLATVTAGQIILTGADAGIGLQWQNGGSLRVAANSRVELLTADSVYLRSGRLYFDSMRSALAPVAANQPSAAEAQLVIDTPHGSVAHLGTQYMAFVDAERLAVSVREGEVRVDGRFYEETASAGQQLTLTGGGRPGVVNISRYGDAWAWAEATAPAAELDGRTVYEFLLWVSRETGLELEFEADSAAELARKERLRGTVDTEPTNALRIWMLGVDLDARVEGGVIYVNRTEPARGP
jgi:ferric-dicitrate binding protein FerR (iron transport regulator)